MLIDVAYGGCDFADTMIAKGSYPHPKGYPIVAGLEISGRIAALGPDVRGVAVGDVSRRSPRKPAVLPRLRHPCGTTRRIPDAMSLEIAATFPIQALTAWHMLHNVSVTRAGDVILLHAIGGGSACSRPNWRWRRGRP